MRYRRMEPGVTLFPFLSVLLSTMGVLAFLSISFLLITPELTEFQDRKQIEFQWVGAPGYVEPIFIRCFEDRIEYFELFKNTNRSVELDSLIQQVKGGESELIRYLFSVLNRNKRIKKQFGNTEYYPLILVYPDGVLTTELLLIVIDQIEGINYGLEPMLPHWNVPYQQLEFQG